MSSNLKSSNGLSYYTESMYEGISEIDNPSLLYVNGISDCKDEHVVVTNYYVFTTPTITYLASDEIKELTIGDRVEIFSTALRHCPNLKKINIITENKYAKKVINNCIVSDKRIVCMCPNSIIPNDNSVNSIGSRVLSAFLNRKEIVIPEGIEFLGEEACYECVNLNSITLPKSLALIGNNAFADCKNLREIKYNGSKEEWEKLKSANPNYSDFDKNIKVIFGGNNGY